MNIEKLKEAGIVSIRDELLRQQAKGKKICRTESGDPSFDPPAAVGIAINKALQEGKTHYTPNDGIPQLREACLQKLKAMNKFCNIKSRDDILVTNGAMHALYLVINTVVENKRYKDIDPTVWVPLPVWTEIALIAKEAGAIVKYYDVNPLNDEIDRMEGIRSIFENETVDVFILNSPQNPTGMIFEKQEIADIVQLCVERDAYLISDEAYEHILYEGKHVSPASLTESKNVISIFSCSKSYAMSGLRIGYIACSEEFLKRRMRKMARFTINGTCSVAQWGAVEAIGNNDPIYLEKMLEEYKERRDILVESLQKCTFLTPFNPQGAFYVWCKIDQSAFKEGKGTGWHVAVKLMAKGVGCAPGEVFGPGQEQYIRFSFSCSTEHIRRAAEILSNL
jgi:aspartate aminotransferase